MALVLSTIIAGLIRNACRIHHPIKKLKLSAKDEKHENIDGEVDEDELYELEKIVLMKINGVIVGLKANSNI